MGGRTLGLLLAGLAVLAALAAGTGSASAHGGGSTGTLSVAQTLGAHELTVTLYPPADGEGDMAVRVVAQGRGPATSLQVDAVPGAGPGAGAVASRAVVSTGSDVRDAPAAVRIDRSGPWEVVLTDGPDVARIPLTVPASVVPGWVWAVRAGLVATALFGLAAAIAGRRRPRLAVALGGGALVAVTVVVTAAVLSTAVPVVDPTATGGTSPDHAGHTAVAAGGAAEDPMAGMDMGSGATDSGEMASGDMAAMSGHGSGAVLLTVTPSPPAPRLTGAGPVVGGVDLALRLTDGSTGTVVDDLAVHDDAFVHLAVMGPQARLWHVHPVRIAPGRYTVRLPLADPGAYGVFAELERADGGHQVARSAFALDGVAGAPAAGERGPTAAPGGPGPRDVAGMRVDATVATPVAGRPTRIALAFSLQGGAPVRDLQAWLGMAGHLMVLGPGAAGSAAPDPTDPRASFAHVHDMGAPGSYGAGPDVGFTYAFPAAGRYQLWAQVQRGGELVTVPIAVDVAPGAGTGPGVPATVNG